MDDPQLLSWLLAARTPSIRYLTLRRLLGRPEEDADVQAARREMAASGPIPAILARQTARGDWANERSYYSPKYTSTHWSMILLAEFAADPTDERLRRGAEFMLADTEADAARPGHGCEVRDSRTLKSAKTRSASASSCCAMSDGTTDATTPTGSFTYTDPGDYTARLTVTDEVGNVRRVARAVEVSADQLQQRTWTSTVPAAVGIMTTLSTAGRESRP